MHLDGHLLLVGCGKMGQALMKGWLDRGVRAQQVVVVEPGEPGRAAAAALGVTAVPEAGAIDPAAVPAVVVLAVKPQQMATVLPDYRGYATPKTVFLSIAAGIDIAAFEAALGAQSAIVRAMPNTPAAVGRGISVLCANSRVSDRQKDDCDHLMAAAGEVAWIEDETLLDAVTAVSGSGPAYVFLMIECLAAAGVEAGLPAELAMRLARSTVSGAGELAHLSDTPAAELRRNVTSPGGTTEAALRVLMAADGLQPLMTRAVAAAKQRGRELGG